MMSFSSLKPEDYTDPACPFCKGSSTEAVSRVPMDRIIKKLDEYMAKRDYDGVERHLLYWLSEAEMGKDTRGQFSLHNELMGHYRKTLNRDKALDHADKALHLLPEIGEDSIGAATCHVNAGTVLDAFSQPGRAIDHFEQAQAIYEKNLKENDARLGGLYNNMALALVELKRFGEAYRYYQRAIDVMEVNENGELEQAITYLNMANAVEAEHGLEKAEKKIEQYCDLAQALLDKESIPRNGYYAYVCEKCAPTFGYYGYFLYENELNARAKSIYERS